MNIVLTGFMASGKTKISKQISSISGYDLVDTDELIVKRMNMSINEIFEKMGESEFRKIEHDVICEVSDLDNTVISTGGGVPLNPDNMKKLRRKGVIINLAPSFDVILSRLQGARSTRPLLKDSNISQIKKRFYDRLPFYSDCDFQISVSNAHSPNFYAKEILLKLKLIQD